MTYGGKLICRMKENIKRKMAIHIRWLINYIRSCFCKHEWELLGTNNVYGSDFDKRPLYHQWIYRCKKCGCKNIIKN